MREVTAGRTLVKSPPELWAVCSDADSLAQHLEAFGEIRITRLEPETTVAWEGDRASGTVRIEPAGWGTKVTVTAATTEPVAAPESVEVPEPTVATPESTVVAAESTVVAPAHEEPASEPAPARRPRFLARLFGGAHGQVSPPALSQKLEPEPVQAEQPAVATEAALEAALDSLGQAHRRPFSR
jgi:hypothetical protein